MAFYRICPDCGSNLDPGERCDCGSESEKKKEEQRKYIKMEAGGQYRLDFGRLECGYREKAVI